MAQRTSTIVGVRASEPTWWQAAAAGSLAGSVAAAATTPLDVVKTRIMLAQVCVPACSMLTRQSHGEAGATADARIVPILQSIVRQNGVRGLFAGVVPRVMWIGLGGAVFLGTFDVVSKMLEIPLGRRKLS